LQVHRFLWPRQGLLQLAATVVFLETSVSDH
jgi:hypothetical protein